MSTYIGPITNSMIDALSVELKKENTQEKITKNIIDPIMKKLFCRYSPYFITITVILLVNVILLILILILLTLRKK